MNWMSFKLDKLSENIARISESQYHWHMQSNCTFASTTTTKNDEIVHFESKRTSAMMEHFKNTQCVCNLVAIALRVERIIYTKKNIRMCFIFMWKIHLFLSHHFSFFLCLELPTLHLKQNIHPTNLCWWCIVKNHQLPQKKMREREYSKVE